MTEKKAPKVDLVLGGAPGKLVRFSYLNVFTPKVNSESGASEYSTMVLIPKANTEDVAAIKKAIEHLQKVTWLDDKKKIPPQFWNPLRDGDNDSKQDGSPFGPEAKGCYLLNAKTGEDYPPNVVGTAKDAKGAFVPLEPKEIKSGDWGRVKITLKSYTKGTGGVGAYLSSLQLKQQGDPLGSQSSAENDFKDFMDEDEADPLA